ncbi:hypothetical protein [Pseudomonas atagonensis]|uniref:hypothetical protein n=1 Tax=Pseudomonas atagonensis TaxID=2609964 RepID=UPI00140D4303|nr:hypothetical protein [Pseudomonas atagonensis]
MNRPNKAPVAVLEPLTFTLQGDDLKHLNDYREAVYLSALENYPEEAKSGNGSVIHQERCRQRVDAAKRALAEILSSKADEQLGAPSRLQSD